MSDLRIDDRDPPGSKAEAPAKGRAQRAASAVKSSARRRSLVVITGAIAPYTHRLYSRLAERADLNVTVLACGAIEPQRQWKVEAASNYSLITLRGLRFHPNYTSHVYVNPGVLWQLAKLRPDRILLDGFSPTMMFAGGYGRITGTAVGINTDGSVATDPGARSRAHRWARKLIIPAAQFGIAASEDSARLLASYGLAEDAVSIVRIPISWSGPETFKTFDERPYDLLFCGSLDEARKGVLFFADVAVGCQRALQKGRTVEGAGRSLKVRIVGDGPMRKELASRLKNAGVEARFDGYVAAPEDLIAAYASAKLFLLPSRQEPWGLVANEAIACGTPVVGSPHAVASLELVKRYDAGIVVPLEAALWSQQIVALLHDRERWTRMQANHKRAAASFAIETSATALAEALGFHDGSPD